MWTRCIDEADRASEVVGVPTDRPHHRPSVLATVFALQGLDSFDVNRVLGLGLDGAPLPSEIDAIVSAYRQLRPSSVPTGGFRGGLVPMRGRVRSGGTCPAPRSDLDGVAGSRREPRSPIETCSVRILEPSDTPELAKLQRTAWGVWEPCESHDLWFSAPLGKEGFTYFGAFLDDELVAAGALFVDGTADRTMAWAGFDATDPRLRRQRLRHELGNGQAAPGSRARVRDDPRRHVLPTEAASPGASPTESLDGFPPIREAALMA